MAGWIRVEADVHRHPRVVALPSAAARWAFIVTLAEGKAVDGRWTSVRHYRACVPPAEARYLPAMVSAGLLVMDGDAVVIHDWDDYQVSRKDPTAAERMRRHRDRQRDASPERDVTRNDLRTSRALSLSMSPSPSQTTDGAEYPVPRAGEDVWRVVQVVEELVGQFGYTRGSPVFEKLAADVVSCGPDRVEATYRDLRTEFRDEPMDVAQLVYGGHKRLFPIPQAPANGRRAAGPKGHQPEMSEVHRAFDQQ